MIHRPDSRSLLHPASRATSVRRGATLVEVLMALLIMAVGVTSIFTLFPLSILRSIKSNQLNNAKLVEENARELILANPQLITGAPPWTPRTTYGTQTPYTAVGGNIPSDCWVTPRPRPGRLLPETNLLYATGSSGISSAFEPKWSNQTVNWTGAQNPTQRGGYNNQNSGYITAALFPQEIHDGTLNNSAALKAWFAYRHSRYAPDPTWSSYVVDPLGWYEMNGQLLTSERNRFGQLDRIHCQLTPTQARELFSSQDTWRPILEQSIPTAVTASVVTFDSLLDLTESRKSGRLVFLSEDGRRTVAMPINPAASQLLPVNQVAWTGTLPTGLDAIVPGEIFQVRIDAFEQRYTWMMTVQTGPQGQAKIDVVIFFNRTFNSLDEEAISAEFHGPSPTFNVTQAMLTWPDTRAGGDPSIKEGGFIFDAANGHWYRIQKVESYVKPVTGTRTALLTLGTSVTVPTSTEAAANYDGQAILLPGIVNVFHIDIE